MRALRRSRGEPAVQTMPEAGGVSWLPNRPPPIFHHLESRACPALHRSHCAGAQGGTARKFTNKPNYQRRSGRRAARSPRTPACADHGGNRPSTLCRAGKHCTQKFTNKPNSPKTTHVQRRAGDWRGLPRVSHSSPHDQRSAGNAPERRAAFQAAEKSRNRGGRLR